MKYFAYILISESHGTYYYGSTANVENRLAEHNKGRVRFTKGRRPWKLHYVEEFESRSAAYQREMFFKTIEGRNWLKAQGIL